jgi:Glycosyltransferase family 87
MTRPGGYSLGGELLAIRAERPHGSMVTMQTMRAQALPAAVESDPLRKALTHSLALWSVAAPIWVLIVAAFGHKFALDFRHTFLPAAHAVLHGTSPYSAIGSRALTEGTAFLYPPLSAYLLVPFTVLPQAAAEIMVVTLIAATVPATLLLLGVRDWRCHAVAFLWWPAIIAIQTANLTLPMLLGLALAWRYRNRTLISAGALAVVVALKLFFWPLLLWPLASRRYRAAFFATVTSAGLVLLPWAGIGFVGLRAYWHLLAHVSRTEGPRSYSVAALLHAVLPSWTAATVLAAVVGVALLLLMFKASGHGRDRDAFALAIVAILVFTPLLEMHYVTLLLVVVALYRRHFALAWLAPLLIWGAPATVAGSAIQVAHVLVVVALTCALVLRDWEPRVLGRTLRVETAC